MQKSLPFLLICVLSICLLSCEDNELDVAFDREAFDYNRNQWKQLNIKWEDLCLFIRVL